jgi:hypothetical protein
MPRHNSTLAEFSLSLEFTNIWESPFDVTNPDFDCSVNRTNGTPATQMYLINHFLDQIILGQPAPDPEQANVTNSARSVVLATVFQCTPF